MFPQLMVNIGGDSGHNLQPSSAISAYPELTLPQVVFITHVLEKFLKSPLADLVFTHLRQLILVNN